jgi:dimethylaniline monooxygenase (N-oxide forming)
LVFAGVVRLPSAAAMAVDIAEKQRSMKRRYFDSPKHTVQVDYLCYMDEIADLIGVKPPLLKVSQ